MSSVEEDPLEIALFTHLTPMCEQCGAYLAAFDWDPSKDVTEWAREVAQHLRRVGWSSPDYVTFLCPDCTAKAVPG